jgi:hypothetical protein
MQFVDFPPSPRVVAPTPHDSAEQQMRWMLLDMHRYWWQATEHRNVDDRSRLTAEIRREWIEQGGSR